MKLINFYIFLGRKEDVAMAKREILSAAEHFSQIRACRKNNLNGSMAPGPPTNVPGQVTIQVRVPYRVVGLVVGPKGATIKRIQQQTHTYIVTPSRDKEPVFEVTGMPESVEQARKEIEAHIAMRTGGILDQDESAAAAAAAAVRHEFTSSQVMDSLFQPPPAELMSSLYKMNTPTINSLNALSSNTLNSLSNGTPSLNSLNGTPSLNSLNGLSNGLTSSSLNSTLGTMNNLNSLNQLNDMSPFSLLGDNGSSLLGSKTNLDGTLFSSLNGTSNKLTDLNSQGFGNIYNNAVDEGLGSIGSSMGSSPSFEPNQTSIWGDLGRSLGTSLSSNISSSTSLSSTFSSLSSTLSSSLTRRSSSVSGASPPSSRLSPSLENHPPARRISSDPAPNLNNSASLASLTSALTAGLGGLPASSSASTTSSTPDLPLSSIANFGTALVGNGSTICTSTATTTCPNAIMSAAANEQGKLMCRVCCESPVVAALVPCGHNSFCMNCATKVVDEATDCPICHVKVNQAIRIFT